MSVRADLDVLGLLCPLPVLKLRQLLKRLRAGDEVVLLCDDPEIERDLPAFCEAAGHALLGLDRVPGPGRASWRALVRKGAI